MNRNVAFDCLGRVCRAAIVECQESKSRLGSVPLFSHRSAGAFDRAARDVPGCMDPIRVADQQRKAVFLGFFFPNRFIRAGWFDERWAVRKVFGRFPFLL